jgi:restriction system protein
MFFRRKDCAACQSKEIVISDLQDQLQKALSEVDRLKQATILLNKAIVDLHDSKENAAVASPKDPEEEKASFKIERGENGSEHQSGALTKEYDSSNGRRQRPSKRILSQADLRTAINAICLRCEKEIVNFVESASSDFRSGAVSAEDIDNFKAMLIECASEINTVIGFDGRAEELGTLLTQDDRAWDYFSKNKLPKIAKAQDAKRIKNHQWHNFLEQLQTSLEKHKPQLISNIRKSYVVNEYGTVELDDRDKEIARYLRSVKLYSKAEAVGYRRVYGYIKTWATREVKKTSINTPLPKNGIDFEYWVADRFNERNWSAQVTQGSGDQGVDVVVNIGVLRVAVQCKLYTGSVGNKAVQEVLAGMSFFDLDRGVIISTGKYTKSAHALAEKNNILLLAPEDIPYLSDVLLDN